jgi:pimeloyl-ACP methyl ester carboxylesterase
VEATGRLDLDDAEFVFWDSGSGEPVLLSHPSFGAEWLTRVGELLPGYRILRTHRPGYGESRDLSGQLSIADRAEHLAVLLGARGISRTHLVGHSSGATIALQLAAAHPELVASIVLLELAFPYAPNEARSDAMRNAIQAAKENDLDKAFDFFPGVVCGPDLRDVLSRALGENGRDESIRSGRYVFDKEIPALAAWDSDAAGLARIDQPTLLVDGTGERVGGGNPYRARHVAMAARLQHAELKSLPAVTHALPVEDPALVAQTIADFLRQHPL